MRTVRRLIALPVLLACAGCQPDPDGRQGAGAEEAPPVVEVTMVDYAFVAPDTIPSGWVTFRATNQGEESHHFHLYRLPEGKTFVDYVDERVVPRDSILRALDAGTMDTAKAREVYPRLVSDWTRSDNNARRIGGSPTGRTWSERKARRERGRSHVKLRSPGRSLLAVLLLAGPAAGQVEPEVVGADGAKASTRAGQDFACTQVLGFSQSLEWFGGLSLEPYTEGAESVELPTLRRGVFLPGWQGRFFPGAPVEDWLDPGHPGWSKPSARGRETPAHCAREEVDRVVFNVSGAARSADQWAAAVDSVAELIQAKFPAVRRVVMQPVVGAPDGECRDVRAARNHPVIAEGIRRAAERGGMAAGPEPRVEGCDQFRDAFGHLTEEGAEHVREALRDHYRVSTDLFEGDRSAVRPESAPELLRRPYTSAETGREREYFVYLPRGYHEAPRKDWPVIFYLHGSGGRGDGREELAWVLAHGPLYEAWIQKRDLPFVIVSPQLPLFGRTEQVEGRSAGGQQAPGRLAEGTPPRYEICHPRGDCLVAPHQRAFARARGEERPIARTGPEEFERIRSFGMDFDYPPEEWPPDGWYRVEEDLVAILDDVLGALRTDPDRVYLTGISYGGFGVFDLAASHPDRWAALAPVVGTGDLEDAPVLAEAGIPIWMFAGGTDPLVKPHWLYEMARALEEAGHPDVRLTVHEDMTHDAWRRVYEARDLYDWFLSQRRPNEAVGHGTCAARTSGTADSLREANRIDAECSAGVVHEIKGVSHGGAAPAG